MAPSSAEIVIIGGGAIATSERGSEPRSSGNKGKHHSHQGRDHDEKFDQHEFSMLWSRLASGSALDWLNKLPRGCH